MVRDRFRQLERYFSDFKRLRPPKFDGPLKDVELDVDIFAQEAWIAGLVDSYLTTGELPSDLTIALNNDIDRRLVEVSRRHPESSVSVAAVSDYWQELKRLAQEFASASGGSSSETE
jgi:hypothetical protein